MINQLIRTINHYMSGVILSIILSITWIAMNIFIMLHYTKLMESKLYQIISLIHLYAAIYCIYNTASRDEKPHVLFINKIQNNNEMPINYKEIELFTNIQLLKLVYYCQRYMKYDEIYKILIKRLSLKRVITTNEMENISKDIIVFYDIDEKYKRDVYFTDYEALFEGKRGRLIKVDIKDIVEIKIDREFVKYKSKRDTIVIITTKEGNKIRFISNKVIQWMIFCKKKNITMIFSSEVTRDKRIFS